MADASCAITSNDLAPAASAASEVLSKEHAQIYDRQIRLWGIDAQRNLLNARILLLASESAILSHLAQELAKNIILAGAGTLLLVALPERVQEMDKEGSATGGQGSPHVKRQARQAPKVPPCGFLGETIDTMVQNLKDMNPLVKISSSNHATDKDAASASSVDILSAAISPDISVVCHVGEFFDPVVIRAASLCEQCNIPYFVASSYGAISTFMVYLGREYEYIEETTKTWKLAQHQTKLSELFGAVTVTSVNGVTKSTEEKPQMKWLLPSKRIFPYFYILQSYYYYSCDATSHDFMQFFLLDCRHHGVDLDHDLIPKVKQEILDAVRLIHLCGKAVKVPSPSPPPPPGDHQDAQVQLQVQPIRVVLPPVEAVVAGVLGREIVKVVTKKDLPVDNLFVFNGRINEGVIERV